MPDKSDDTIRTALRQWRLHAGGWLRAAVAIGLGAGLLLLLQAWLLARAVDAVVFQHAGLDGIMPLLGAMLGIFAVRAILAWASERAAFEAAVRVKLGLRDLLYRHVQRLGPAWLSGERSGDVVNALSDGVEALEAYYARYLPAMSLAALVPLALLVFVFANDWISGLVMIITAPLIPLFMILIGKGAERRNQRQWRQLAWMSAHFLDMIQGLTTLKLFNASRREAQMVASISDQYRQQTMSVLRIAFLSSFALEFFATVSIAVVAVLVGFRLLWGDMTVLHGFFVLLLAPEFYLPLRNMGTQYHARMEAIGAAERIVDILNTAPPAAGGTQAVPDLSHSEIRFEGVSYRYPDGRQGVRDLDLVIPPGKTLALVGASGMGKTTLINLLMGFLQPESGRILVGSTPLQEIDPAAWRRQLAWLPQQPHLFPGSVADNIALGLADPDPEAIRGAARRAQADGFITALPEAYATPIGETGHGLSGGQVQRIALARAFMKDAPLVILDEAGANLDRENEERVHQGLRALAQGRTVVMIAHRLHTVRDADCIVLLKHGSVAASGGHESLLEGSADYRRLVHAGEAAR